MYASLEIWVSAESISRWTFPEDETGRRDTLIRVLSQWSCYPKILSFRRYLRFAFNAQSVASFEITQKIWLASAMYIALHTIRVHEQQWRVAAAATRSIYVKCIHKMHSRSALSRVHICLLSTPHLSFSIRFPTRARSERCIWKY